MSAKGRKAGTAWRTSWSRVIIAIGAFRNTTQISVMPDGWENIGRKVNPGAGVRYIIPNV